MENHSYRTNRALLVGWGTITALLLFFYTLEVLKGERTLSYLLTFVLFTVLPVIAVTGIYLSDKKSEKLKFFIVTGYSLMYGFVLFTGNTPLVWTYIIPILFFLVLYHDPKLILYSGIITLILNFSSIAFRYYTGNDLAAKNIEIQIAVLLVCYIGLYGSTRIYSFIYSKNIEYNAEILQQKEEIFQQAEELEAMNGELSSYSEELVKKNEDLREMAMQTIMTIANTIDAKDEYTRGHSRRVSEYSVAIARELGFEGDDLRDIRFVGLLHDIGKIGVPDNVLNKPGKLTPEEYQLMKDHTVIGGDILKDITMINHLDIGAKYHHERFDGTGYPEGLKGEEIPVIARIIGVADAYDAMTSNRVYRRHLESEKVMEELKNGRGRQFDPDVCDILVRLIDEDRLPSLKTEEDSTVMEQSTTILSRVIDKAGETAIEDIQYDELTGTLSREHGIRLMQDQIGKHGTGSVFVFDIDNFRRINEKDGFVTGDQYLSLLAGEIKKLGEGIVISRFGSDEFVTYLPDIDSEEEAESCAAEFIERIKNISENDSTFAMFSVSIGITQVATEKDRVMVLYENASKALFVAKQYGEGSFYYHRVEMEEDDDVALANSADLWRLIEYIKAPEENGNMSKEHSGLFSSIKELMRGNKDPLYIVLFTLRRTGEIQPGVIEHENIMTILEKAIRISIRKDDITMRYSNVQHLILLTGIEESLLRQIINRIMGDFYKTNDNREIELHYDAADLRNYI